MHNKNPAKQAGETELVRNGCIPGKIGNMGSSGFGE